MQNPYIQTLQAGASVANQAYGQASQSMASVANIFNSSASLAMKMSALLEQEEARKQQQALQIADYMHKVQQDEFMNKFRTRVQDFNEINAKRNYELNKDKFEFNKDLSTKQFNLQKDSLDFAKSKWNDQKALQQQQIIATKDKARADLLKQQLDYQNSKFNNAIKYINSIPKTIKVVLPNGQIIEKINPEYEKALQIFGKEFGITQQQQYNQQQTIDPNNNSNDNSFVNDLSPFLYDNKLNTQQDNKDLQLNKYTKQQYIVDADGKLQPNPNVINDKNVINYNTIGNINNITQQPTLGSISFKEPSAQQSEQQSEQQNKYLLSNLDIQQIMNANFKNTSKSFIEPMQRKVDYTLGYILNSNMSPEEKFNRISGLMTNSNMNYLIKNSPYYSQVKELNKYASNIENKTINSINEIKNVQNSLNNLSTDNLTGEGLFLHTLRSLFGFDNMNKAQQEQVGSIIHQNPTLAIPLSIGMYMANSESSKLDFVYDNVITPIKKWLHKATPVDEASVASNVMFDKPYIGANRFMPLGDDIINKAKKGDVYAKSALEAYNYGLPQGKTYNDILNLKTCAEYGNRKCLNELKQLDNEIYKKFSIRLNQISNIFLKEKGYSIDGNINAKELTNKVITWLGNDKVAKRLGFKNGKDAITQYLYMSYFISDKVLEDANENYNSINE